MEHPKHARVLAALNTTELQQLSDRALAKQLQVSRRTIGRLRRAHMDTPRLTPTQEEHAMPMRELSRAVPEADIIPEDLPSDPAAADAGEEVDTADTVAPSPTREAVASATLQAAIEARDRAVERLKEYQELMLAPLARQAGIECGLKAGILLPSDALVSETEQEVSQWSSFLRGARHRVAAAERAVLDASTALARATREDHWDAQVTLVRRHQPSLWDAYERTQERLGATPNDLAHSTHTLRQFERLTAEIRDFHPLIAAGHRPPDRTTGKEHHG
jgi:hypothetical protein